MMKDAESRPQSSGDAQALDISAERIDSERTDTPKTGSVSVSAPHDTSPTATVSQIIHSYRARTIWRLAVLGGLFLLLLAVFVLSIMVGPFRLSVSEVISAIFVPDSVTSDVAVVVNNLRLPLACLAIFVGAALALGGVQMQTILDNPLAEPFTLGISGAAAFGAAFSIVFQLQVPGFEAVTTTLAAWVMAMLACIAIGAVSLWRGATTETLVLLGIAFVFVFSALLSLMQYSASTEALSQIVFWTMGSLSRATWPAVLSVALSLVVCIPVFIGLSWKLTALRLGEDRARALGVNTRMLRVVAILLVSLLAATAVAFAGIIGFIGLIGPHIARILLGEDQRFLIPGSLLCGAILLSAAHALSQVLVPGVILPVGIITAIVGVPVFVTMILLRRKNAWSSN